MNPKNKRYNLVNLFAFLQQQEMVPCVLLSFDDEQVLMWRGREWKSMYKDETPTINDFSSETHKINDSSGETSSVANISGTP